MHSPAPPPPNLDPVGSPAEVQEAAPDVAAWFNRQAGPARNVADAQRKFESAAEAEVEDYQRRSELSAELDAATRHAAELAAQSGQRPERNRKPQRKPGR